MNYCKNHSNLDTMKETMTHIFHTTAMINVRMLTTNTPSCTNAIQIYAIGKKYGRKTFLQQELKKLSTTTTKHMLRLQLRKNTIVLNSIYLNSSSSSPYSFFSIGSRLGTLLLKLLQFS